MKAGLVIIVTGGSSGIGRMTARALAAKAAHLVLVARHAPALEEAAEECRALGAASVAVCPADICDVDAIATIGRETLARHGRIDVWINNAAQLGFSRFEETPPEVFRQIIETNVLGTANGARTALQIFRQQGAGHLINVGSMLGRVTEPLVSAYAGSKGAVAGMTRVMQQELRAEPNIHVSLALPWAIDTPIYQRAANFTGHGVRTIFPVYGAERAASALVALVERPHHEKLIGAASYLAAIGLRLSLNLTLKAAGWVGPKMQVTPGKQEASFGALRKVDSLHATSGGWRKYWWGRITSGFRGPG